MGRDVNTFHHLGIITGHLASAVETYSHLGFTLTPLSLPEFPLSAGALPERVGVANRNVILKNSYVEILGVVEPGRWASISTTQRGPFDIDVPLGRYEGLHVMHFGTDNLDGVHDRLVRQKLNPSPICPFQREVETPEGVDLMRARCLSFAPGTHPEALFQIVQHETPELALQPRFMTHANGAIALSELIMCVDEPEQVAKRYGQYAGRPAVPDSYHFAIHLDDARLIITDRRGLQELLPKESAPVTPYLAGFTVTADLDHTAAFLKRHDIPFDAFDGRIIVASRNAGGSAVVFETPDN